MSSNVHIKDGEGSKRTAGVTTRNALKVTVVYPSGKELVETGEIEQLAERHQLSGYFLNPTYGNDQTLANGSVTPVDFVLEAEPGVIKEISQIRFVIAGKGMTITSAETRSYSSSFSVGLTNGIRLYAIQGDVVTDIFIEPVKQIFEYYLYQDDIINDPGAYSSSSDVLIVTINFSPTIVLVPTLSDKLIVRIQDDFAGATNIYMHKTIFYGSKINL